MLESISIALKSQTRIIIISSSIKIRLRPVTMYCISRIGKQTLHLETLNRYFLEKYLNILSYKWNTKIFSILLIFFSR